MSHHLMKVALTVLLGIGLARTGEATAQVYYNPTATTYQWFDLRGNAFNNSLSAMSSNFNYQNNFMQQMFQQQNTNMSNAALAMQQQAAFDQQIDNAAAIPRGNAIIKAGKATTVFRPQPYTPPYAQWAKDGGISVERAKWEYGEQMKVWNEAARRYGANLNDYAQMYALAGMVAFEGYTGQRPSQAAYQALLAIGRKFFLTDPKFQGINDQQKSGLSVNLFLSGYSVFERQEYGRSGDSSWLERAKKDAAYTMNLLWDSDTAGLSDADDLVRMLGQYGANPAPVVARQSQPSPYSSAASTKPPTPASTGLSWQQAVSRANFKRAANPVLPDWILKQQLGGQNSATLAKLSGEIIGQARRAMQQDNPENLPLDNVATSMIFAFSYLYVLGKTEPGAELGRGITTPSDAVLKKLWERAVYSLASNQKFAALSQVEKQKMAEFCLFVPSFGVLMYQYAGQEKNLQSQKMAVQMAQ